MDSIGNIFWSLDHILSSPVGLQLYSTSLGLKGFPYPYFMVYLCTIFVLGPIGKVPITSGRHGPSKGLWSTYRVGIVMGYGICLVQFMFGKFGLVLKLLWNTGHDYDQYGDPGM